ncbi:MAG TPA: nucleotidyltransferase family protein [Caulobacteraceae bacterium]
MGTEDQGLGESRFEAILLAAGSGRRFGGGKLLAPWRGRPLIEASLVAALAAPVRRVVLVTGAELTVGEVARECAERNKQSARLSVVHAPDHAEGMGASLRTGAAALEPHCAGAFVFLGDMPAIPPDIGPRLAQALADGALAAAPTFHGRRGHPALFSAVLIPDLARSSGDEGARRVLQSLGDRLALVETNSPGVLTDIDTPQDLE